MVYALLTAFTLVAFAANSLLCRMALGAQLIDPVSFSTPRLASGALILVPLARIASKTAPNHSGSWLSGVALFVYAMAFSLAYVWLGAGIGALILFGTVQATMIGTGMKTGDHPQPLEWLGLLAALGGLVYLIAPGIASPDPVGSLLMCLSGLAWGIYSLQGKKAVAPVSATAGNFVRSLPLAAVSSALAVPFFSAQATGILLAVVSGSVTSGLGYVLWYRALRGLRTAQAAIVQLLVPILAALGGIFFLGERLSVRLAISSVLILGGVAMAVGSRSRDTGASRSALTRQ